jgi:hypothetical protein
MSLISKFLASDSQKYLLSKNLLFVIEKVLQLLQKGDIDTTEAKFRIDKIIDTDGKIEFEEKVVEIVEEIEEVSFVSDDEQCDSNEVSFLADQEADSISSMFDVYLSKPSQRSEFNPFSSLKFEPEFSPKLWTLPIVNWSKVSKLNDCVILYRTHSQSRSIEEIFLKNKVPYRLVSGTRFLDRKEIRDVMSILKYMGNGADKISLSRFLPLVLDGVGAKTLEKILAYMEDYEYPLAPKFQEMIVTLLTRIQTAWSTSKTLIEFCKEVQIVSGYTKYLKKEFPNKDDFNERMENIGEIYSLMLPFDQDESLDITDKLSNFLSQISLMSLVDNTTNDPDQPKINLMSLHQSKGLEYETVFMVGCEDGLLPHQNSFVEPDGMEEEVRLAYVGVTRAKANLYLLSADSRVTFGQIKANPASRIFRPFLDRYCRREK